MPNSNLQVVSRLLGATVEELDISPQQFELAVHRYMDLGQWLVALGIGDPDVYPQGSFRLGTVLRPTAVGDFDIDLVFLRFVAKESITQDELRSQAGQLLRAYISARGAGNGNPTLKERGRCWELIYSGDRFHMDVLPVIPDPDGDDTAVLLSDRDMFLWQHSNPVGYADWFWSSMGEAVDVGRAQLAATLSREVEDVPRWLVRTTLQRVVQLLKLHRDTFFRSNPHDKPASILITTLATHAYGGESDLYEAFRKVARTLPSRVEWRNDTWWVPNPAHEEENFADKWNTSPNRKRHFERWIEALIAETDRWTTSHGVDEAVKSLGTAFGVAPVKAGAKRVAAGLAALAPSAGLGVDNQGDWRAGAAPRFGPTTFMAQTDRRTLALVREARLLDDHYPHGQATLKAGGLRWTGELQPSEVSRQYQVDLRYTPPHPPRVLVRRPKLVIDTDGKPAPHLSRRQPLSASARPVVPRRSNRRNHRALGV